MMKLIIKIKYKKKLKYSFFQFYKLKLKEYKMKINQILTKILYIFFYKIFNKNLIKKTNKNRPKN